MNDPAGNPTVLNAIRELLRSRGVAFRELRHEPTLTSEDSARVRGESLKVGGKALLMNVDGRLLLFVLPADRRIDSGAVRRTLGVRKMRFATREELLAETGLVPGSVPPFGPPILPFPLYVDAALAENDRIAFNAGMLTDSIILAMDDYRAVAAPTSTFAFSTPPES